MDYQKSLLYIHSLSKFGTSLGLERIGTLLKMLGNPQENLKFIHVAGTNGKGTVCNLCANVLQEAGYKTGLFTSPFVSDFCERMQIDGEMISHDKLAKLVAEVKPMVDKLADDGIKPAEFEIVTAIAMKYFETCKCDIVVLETGLGGRFDATNVITTPLLSVITCISLDHIKILGNTIEKIAMEKSGIIKDNGTTICYPCQLPSAVKVIEDTANQRNNDFKLGCLNDIEVLESTISHTKIKWNDKTIKLKLIGEHQVINTSTAITALLELRKKGFNISDNDIKNGIEKTSIPARFEVLSQSPLIILDGAHNSDGIDSLASSLEKLIPNKKKIFVMGTMKDKDYKFTIERIARMSYKFVATTPLNLRSLHACNVLEIAKPFCKRTVAISSPLDAINYALYKNKSNEYAIIICGSLYLAGDVREFIVKKLPLLQA